MNDLIELFVNIEPSEIGSECANTFSELYAGHQKHHTNLKLTGGEI